MPSKQLNFFIMPEDWKQISEVLEKQNVYFIKVPLKDSSKIFTKTIADKKEGESYRVYLTNEEYKNKIFFEHGDDKKTLEVDILKSYAIEFDRAGFFPYSSQILHRARFYTVTKYFDKSGKELEKDADFIKWVTIIYKVIKKEFLKKIEGQDYITFSENTIKWIQSKNGKVDTAGLKITAEK